MPTCSASTLHRQPIYEHRLTNSMMSRNLAAASAAIFLALLAPPASQAAPLGLASINVSLTVQEACIVQSADGVIDALNQPVVSCLHGAPFQIGQAGFDPLVSVDPGAARSEPVAYAATGDAQQTVWTVNF
ncbi:hypothetical protein SAMN05443245_1211 [Paraburkholderia fungorum]|uniref:Uncharacterized protein n=2 Tax=Paraburkholderia fungorum TaxID=134537 RepID=A0A1H1AK44_9BURK|nr:hypothetical protein SAMN05443245_1211 [Paraburkholderia fungorum]